MLDAVAYGDMDRYRPDARPSEAVMETATTPWTASYRRRARADLGVVSRPVDANEANEECE